MIPLEPYIGMHGEPFINIWNCRATIARDVSLSPTSLTSEYCINADDFYDDILDEIDRQGGAINMSGRMICPPELATKAIWPT